MKNKGAQLAQAPGIPPAGMPKLFFFEYDCYKEEFQAVMCPELAQRYEKIRIGADDADLKLAWALEISSKISPPSLDCLINKMGGIRLMLTDEQCENDFGEAMAPDTKSELIGVMIQCCQVVQAFQDSMNPAVMNLIGKFNEKTDLRRQKEASKALKKQFGSALRVLTKEKVHGRTKKVAVSYANGTSANLPLAARIIEMTLEVATRGACIPCKAEIEDTMKAAYPRLKESSINWSEEFKKAGLSNLPDFKPWQRDENEAEDSKKNVPRKKKINTDRNAARTKRS